MRFHNHTAPASTEYPITRDSFPTVGFLSHGEIARKVAALIQPQEMYTVTDVAPGGKTISREISGYTLHREYGSIFGNYLHAFIVWQKGQTLPVFAYDGPISGRVRALLALENMKK